MQEYYVLNRDPDAESVFNFIKQYQLQYEIHLNRTRFTVPPGPVYTLFRLSFPHLDRVIET